MRFGRTRPSGSGRERGFTLLEVTLALGLVVMLMGGIYTIARGSLELGTEIALEQRRQMLIHSFVQLCKRNIEGLPGNGTLTLQADEDGRFYVTELAFAENPLAFTFAAIPAGFEKVVLKSEADARGYLQVKLLFLNEEEAELYDDGGFKAEELGVELPLLTEVSVFEWRFYDEDLEEWQVEWLDDTKRPSFVEMNLGFFDGGDPVRTVFWVPPVANPEQVIGGGQGGGRGGPGPGQGGPGQGGPGQGGPGPGGPGQGQGPGGQPGGGARGGVPVPVQPRVQ
ncbi:MAG: prepilin-type N-terminal cleavage/methylation domain-containing protein [Verrucomicrobiota bacterium]